MSKEIVVTNTIENRIFTIRGQKVMIDRDLAELYGIPTFRLNEAVKRNIKRFPEDFLFKLSKNELNEVIAICDNLQSLKFTPSTPFAFTEQGVAMLSSILNTEQAINVNISIMRAFVKLRHHVLSQTDTAERISELHKLLMLHIESNEPLLNIVIDFSSMTTLIYASLLKYFNSYAKNHIEVNIFFCYSRSKYEPPPPNAGVLSTNVPVSIFDNNLQTTEKKLL